MVLARQRFCRIESDLRRGEVWIFRRCLRSLQNIEDKWIAINEADSTIVATGDSIFDVDRDAEKKGYENVLLFKVPRFDVGYIP